MTLLLLTPPSEALTGLLPMSQSNRSLALFILGEPLTVAPVWEKRRAGVETGLAEAPDLKTTPLLFATPALDLRPSSVENLDSA